MGPAITLARLERLAVTGNVHCPVKQARPIVQGSALTLILLLNSVVTAIRPVRQAKYAPWANANCFVHPALSIVRALV